MNTEVRRNIFCVIMTSEDYLDAFEKLLRFHRDSFLPSLLLPINSNQLHVAHLLLLAVNCV